MQVTNGKVTFSRTIKPADYEGITSAVELSFLVEEGDDVAAAVNSVAKMAQEQALERLGRRVAALPDTKMAVTEPAATTKKSPGRPPKAAAAVLTVGPAPVSDNDNAQASADARKAEYAAKENTADAASVVEAGDDAVLGADSVPEINDKTLTDAITRKNAALQKTIGAESPKKIRALIAKYAGPSPKQSRDIPTSKRQDFIKELEALA